MTLAPASKPTRRVIADRMLEAGAANTDFVVFESDIGYSTYSYLFGDAYPARYFNMGIAELGTMAAAAGMAAEGRPVVVCGYGVFLSMRALEAVRSFVCYPRLNVKIFSSHGGVTAAIDGVTHQATEDIAFMGTLPGMTVLVPCDSASATAAFDLALGADGPVFVRLMRDPLFEVYPAGTGFRIGGSAMARKGRHVTIAAYGDMVIQSLEAAALLETDGVEAEVLDLYSVKPFDEAALRESLSRTGALVVAENHQVRNGLGYALASWCMRNGVHVPFAQIGLQDTFAESGSYPLTLEKFGMDPSSIAAAARAVIGRKKRSEQ
ncbi:MAG: transketolase [Spirochaetae bacterium HGW-Spirochaetae-7]|jgi:transketolase|nr:MAG: transketolase [Spirochaetae bacterium HGW-Spirochaetae-7]